MNDMQCNSVDPSFQTQIKSENIDLDESEGKVHYKNQ